MSELMTEKLPLSVNNYDKKIFAEVLKEKNSYNKKGAAEKPLCSVET